MVLKLFNQYFYRSIYLYTSCNNHPSHPLFPAKISNLLNLITLALHFNYLAKFFKFSQILSYDKIVTFIKFNSNSIKFIKKFAKFMKNISNSPPHINKLILCAI